jgi:hypothetical protein
LDTEDRDSRGMEVDVRPVEMLHWYCSPEVVTTVAAVPSHDDKKAVEASSKPSLVLVGRSGGPKITTEGICDPPAGSTNTCLLPIPHWWRKLHSFATKLYVVPLLSRW